MILDKNGNSNAYLTFYPNDLSSQVFCINYIYDSFKSYQSMEFCRNYSTIPLDAIRFPFTETIKPIKYALDIKSIKMRHSIDSTRTALHNLVYDGDICCAWF